MKKAFRATEESICHVCRTEVLGELVVEGSRKRIIHLRCQGEMTDTKLHSIRTVGADPIAFLSGSWLRGNGESDEAS